MSDEHLWQTCVTNIGGCEGEHVGGCVCMGTGRRMYRGTEEVSIYWWYVTCTSTIRWVIKFQGSGDNQWSLNSMSCSSVGQSSNA